MFGITTHHDEITNLRNRYAHRREQVKFYAGRIMGRVVNNAEANEWIQAEARLCDEGDDRLSAARELSRAAGALADDFRCRYRAKAA